MAVSISKIAEQIGAKRQLIARLHAEQAEQFNVVDAQAESIDKVMAKHKEGGSEPSEEDVKSIKASEDAIAAARLKAQQLGDQIRAAEADKAKLEDEKRDREQHNATEQSLNASTGRHIGGDGASLIGAAGTSSGVRVLPPTAEQLDADLSCLVRCIALAGNNPANVPRIAEERFGNSRVSAAMQGNTFASGGALIPDVYMPRLIDGLYATAIVRSMGIPTVPIEFGSLSMPRITSTAIAKYAGEGQKLSVTGVGTDRMQLIPKELGALLPVNNILLGQSSPGADTIIRNQLSIGVGLGEDLAFLRGAKAGAGPTGLRYQAASANVFQANGTLSVTNIEADAAKAELCLINANVPMLMPYWVMTFREFVYLSNLRDANSNLIYPTLQGPNPTWRGKPVKCSTQLPINLGSGNKSEVMLLDASQQMIGQNPQIMMTASSEAAYTDPATGSLVSAYERNETVLRILMYNDIATMHPESIAVITDVAWGA